MKSADLHLHTVFSDGTYTPQELIVEAKKASLACIAVTDHDTVSGIPAAEDEARVNDIEVLPGIELTAEYRGLEIHILGYCINYQDEDLIKKLAILKDNRVERIYQILEKLRGLGVKLSPEQVFGLSGPAGTIGRLHIARAMVREKLVGSISEAFARFIGDKSPAYVLGFKLTPEEAIKLIKSAGGISVLAHPYIIDKEDIVSKLIECGIMGLEAYYSEHSSNMTKKYLELAEKYGLLVTGGSDFHGTAKPDVRIGSTRVPYELVEKLKQAKEKIDEKR